MKEGVLVINNEVDWVTIHLDELFSFAQIKTDQFKEVTYAIIEVYEGLHRLLELTAELAKAYEKIHR